MEHALGVAFERIAAHGVVTLAVRRSHHIACLAALVKQATDRGFLAILATSDPAFGFVAPFGGREPLLTPNPFAIGYPASRSPVLVDISASITTVSMIRQKAAAGVSLEHPWLMDASGRPTTDPRVLEKTDPRGSLLLLGGLEYGHKGFGLALMVEALTQGLAGFGRKDTEKRWGGNVFLQVLDPEAFAGREAFLQQVDHLADRCHANAPAARGGTGADARRAWPRAASPRRRRLAWPSPSRCCGRSSPAPSATVFPYCRRAFFSISTEASPKYLTTSRLQVEVRRRSER